MNGQSNTQASKRHQQSSSKIHKRSNKRGLQSLQQMIEQAFNETDQDPEKQCMKGIFPIGRCMFGTNNALLGITLNLKPNTINRYLREGPYTFYGKGSVHLKNCPDQKTGESTFIMDTCLVETMK